MDTTLKVRLCESCLAEHSGKFGSGRFCKASCARSFATKSSRKEISAKVSAKLKGRPPPHNKGFKTGEDARRVKLGPVQWTRAVQVVAENRRKFYETSSWDELPLAEKRRRVKAEQESKCLWCGTSSWRGTPLTLELDHINGVPDDNRRENMRYLCPNCHSQTPTYRNKKREPTCKTPP